MILSRKLSSEYEAVTLGMILFSLTTSWASLWLQKVQGFAKGTPSVAEPGNSLLSPPVLSPGDFASLQVLQGGQGGEGEGENH